MPRGLLYPWLIQYLQFRNSPKLCRLHLPHYVMCTPAISGSKSEFSHHLLAYFLLYPNRRWLLVSDDHSVSHFALSEGIAGFLLIPFNSQTQLRRFGTSTIVRPFSPQTTWRHHSNWHSVGKVTPGPTVTARKQKNHLTASFFAALSLWKQVFFISRFAFRWTLWANLQRTSIIHLNSSSTSGSKSDDCQQFSGHFRPASSWSRASA